MFACAPAHAQVKFQWTGVESGTGAPWPAMPVAANTKTLIVPGPVPVRHGAAQLLTLTATIEGAPPGASASVNVAVAAVGSPLVAAIKGPSDFKAAATAIISAAGSYDPDGAGVNRQRGQHKTLVRGRPALQLMVSPMANCAQRFTRTATQTSWASSRCATSGRAPGMTAGPALVPTAVARSA